MFIQTEDTPNPQTLKFMPGKVVVESGTHSFTTPEAASASPLAEKLFRVPGVEGVFVGRDFISVTKSSEREWYALKPPILGAIMEHFVAQKPLFYATVSAGGENLSSLNHSESGISIEGHSDPIVKEIIELLETRVRPSVAMDGGDITFERFEDGIVYVKLQGACSGCPSSSMTLKSGIESMLTYYIPEVIEVRAS